MSALSFQVLLNQNNLYSQVKPFLSMKDEKNLRITNKALKQIIDQTPQDPTINETPKTGKRSYSLERAISTVQLENNLSKMKKITNEWVLLRSNYQVPSEKERHLREFRCLLQSAILSLLTGIKTLTSSETNIEEKPPFVASLIDSVSSALFGLLNPICGVAATIASPVSNIATSRRKQPFIKLSSLLPSYNGMDEISAEFASFLTAYNQAEILYPSKKPTVVKEKLAPIRRFIKSVWKFLTSSTLKEKFITGIDDKIEAIDKSYKAHWENLLTHIVEKFLEKVDTLSFDNVENHEIAELLSHSLTPVSHQPLVFNSSKEILSHTLSRVSLLAYETESKIKELAKLWNYSCEFFFNEDIQGFIFHNLERTIVSFRGTDTAANILTDLKFLKTSPWENHKIKVHTGFWKGLQKIWPSMKEKIFLSQPKNIYFTGHSLGGALALLAAVDLSNDLKDADSIRIVTYGQPKCGNDAFISKVNKTFQRYYRVVNYLDPVTEVPTKAVMGYFHAGDFLCLDAFGKILWDEKSYNSELKQLDKFGKRKIRTNHFNQMLHSKNHQMTLYEEKLSRLASSNKQPFFSYSEYLHHELQEEAPNSPYLKDGIKKAIQYQSEIIAQRKETSYARLNTNPIVEESKSVSSEEEEKSPDAIPCSLSKPNIPPTSDESEASKRVSSPSRISSYTSLFEVTAKYHIIDPKGDPCDRLQKRIRGIALLSIFAPITAIADGINCIVHLANKPNDCYCISCSTVKEEALKVSSNCIALMTTGFS